MAHIGGPAPGPTGPLLSFRDLFDETSLHQALSTSIHSSHRRKSDEDSSVTTILSGHSECSHDHDVGNMPVQGDDGSAASPSLASKLTRLQHMFDHRDRMLDRLSQTQKPALMRAIRKRELVVRQQERELLLLQHSLDDSHIDEMAGDDVVQENEPQTLASRCKVISEDDDGNERDSTVWYDALQNTEESPPITAFHNQAISTATSTDTFFRRFYATLLFEWHIGARATMSLLFHTLAHASIYDVVEIGVEEFRRCSQRYLPVSSSCMQLIGNLVVFVVGVAMMRLSGYLYWWLNDMDFKTIKFDLHNRLRLGFVDARYMLWVKRRPLFQASAYFVGYYLCYKVIFDAYEKFFYIFFENEDDDVLKLPNTASAAGHQVGGLAFKNLPFRRILDFLSFGQHWEAGTAQLSGDDKDEELTPVLMAPLAGAVFCAACFVISITFLRCYGFGFFDKY